MRPTNSVIYGTLRYTLQAIRCCASYILLSRLGIGINFIQWILLRSYNDTQFVAVALFVVTLEDPFPRVCESVNYGKSRNVVNAISLA